jgi:hypothetical protein
MIARLILEAQVRHVRPHPSTHRGVVSQLSNPEPTPLVPVPAQAPTARLQTSSRPRGRLALGVLLVLVAVLGGALFLQRAQRLQPVYVAARDLPSGTVLSPGDLALAAVRLPAAELRLYLRPAPSRPPTGRVLTTPVARDALVPVAATATSAADADMVELPVKVDPGDLARGLRPGDSVRVLAAYGDGPRRGQAVVLLPAAEVIHVLQDPDALGGAERQTGVQVRMPSDRAPLVAAAIASARIFVLKAPTRPATVPNPTDGRQRTWPPSSVPG